MASELKDRATKIGHYTLRRRAGWMSHTHAFPKGNPTEGWDHQPISDEYWFPVPKLHEEWAHRSEASVIGPSPATMQFLIHGDIGFAIVEPSIDARGLVRRVARTKTYFDRKAMEVFGDDDAVGMLATLTEAKTMSQADFGISPQGLAFAKLAAAGFVEIGARVVNVTENGLRFIRAIEEKWNSIKVTSPNEP